MHSYFLLCSLMYVPCIIVPMYINCLFLYVYSKKLVCPIQTHAFYVKVFYIQVSYCTKDISKPLKCFYSQFKALKNVQNSQDCIESCFDLTNCVAPVSCVKLCLNKQLPVSTAMQRQQTLLWRIMEPQMSTVKKSSNTLIAQHLAVSHQKTQQ